MNDIKVLNYKDFLKDSNLGIISGILMAKFGGSLLIGPIVNDHFDVQSFIKRIKSNCIYDYRKYKNVSSKVALNLCNMYANELGDNEIIEITKEEIIKHKLLKVPGDNYVEE